MPEMHKMIGKEVLVFANGMQYSGVLVEVSDTEVHLKGAFQWLALPISSISDIVLKGHEESRRELNSKDWHLDEERE
jgi:hypothetical protein